MSRKHVIVITGASKGIGLAVTRSVIQQGGIAVALSRSRAPELLALQGPSLLIINCDVTDEVAFNDAINLVVKTHTHIDGIVLNAGVLIPLGRIDSDVPLSAWREHFEINFFGLVIHLRATLPHLRKSELGGKVIFVSSGAANRGVGAWGPYNCSKAAMNGLCRTLAEEEPSVISVAVRPGMVDTNMQATLRQNEGDAMTPEDHNVFISAHQEGRLVKPEDSGYVLASLAIQAPKQFNGKFISWDGEECLPFRRPTRRCSEMLVMTNTT